MSSIKSMSNTTRFIILIVIALLASIGYIAYGKYQWLFAPNVKVTSGKTDFYVKTGTSVNDLMTDLIDKGFITDQKSFRWVASIKKFNGDAKAGRYILINGMSNNELINILRSGRQTPVKITFNNVRTKEQLAGRVAQYFEFDSAQLIDLLNDKSFVTSLGFTNQNVIAMFMPDTYELYWNTSPTDFCEKMNAQYQKFWDSTRIQKANKAGLTPTQVATLASIVQAEQSKFDDEKPIIAGLYINRLRKDILLQSDPTVVFAVGDFSLQRVLNSHLQINSPYNTYKYKGLPPGPINMPDKSSVEAVLNYDENEYLYMCAKEDFSGRHYFSKTLDQHNQYARKYWNALNKSGIR